jgi:hypothetical protein
VYSFYGQWQRLKFWALLEAFTFRGLMDPRQLQPAQVFEPGWDRDMRDRLMTWTVGHPRLLRLVEDLEADDWLSKLYFVREILHWGEVRTYEPRLIAERGEAIYSRRYKDEYERTHRGEFVVIEVTTEGAFLGRTAEVALQTAYQAIPKGLFHLIRIGEPG